MKSVLKKKLHDKGQLAELTGGTQGMPGSSAGTASGRNSRAMTAMGSNGNVLQNKVSLAITYFDRYVLDIV